VHTSAYEASTVGSCVSPSDCRHHQADELTRQYLYFSTRRRQHLYFSTSKASKLRTSGFHRICFLALRLAGRSSKLAGTVDFSRSKLMSTLYFDGQRLAALSWGGQLSHTSLPSNSKVSEQMDAPSVNCTPHSSQHTSAYVSMRQHT
jgi:hypothetical protein